MTSLPTEKPLTEQVLIAIFDSYCKTIIRNEGRNRQRSSTRRNEREVVSEDPTQYAFCSDVFPSEFHILEVAGVPCYIHNMTLYEAIRVLPEGHFVALFMSFWCDERDKEIANHLGRTERTIRNWRRTSLAQLREHMSNLAVEMKTEEESQE